MTDRERTRQLVAEAAVLVEFADIPLGMTCDEYRARVNAAARLERARGRRLRRAAVRLGLVPNLEMIG